MSDKIRVRFLVDRQVKDAVGTVYKAGDVHEFSPDSAAHWLSRGVAAVVKESVAATTLVESAQAEPAEPAAESLPVVAEKVDDSAPAEAQMVQAVRPKNERQKPDGLKRSDIKKLEAK